MVTKRKLALVSALTSTIVLVSTASQSASLDALLDPPHHAAERPTDDATPVLSLDEGVRLSLIDQPILSGHEAVINANEPWSQWVNDRRRQESPRTEIS
jgi:hypothetical protein